MNYEYIITHRAKIAFGILTAFVVMVVAAGYAVADDYHRSEVGQCMCDLWGKELESVSEETVRCEGMRMPGFIGSNAWDQCTEDLEWGERRRNTLHEENERRRAEMRARLERARAAIERIGQ